MEKHKRTIEGQSKTLLQAVKEYQRRYKRSPPHGFQKWFEYAQAVESKYIDDFDTIEESLAPFWSLSGNQILDRIKSTVQTGDSHLAEFIIDAGAFSGSGDWASEQMRQDIGHEIVKGLPDVMILFNTLDEPRVIPLKDVSPSRYIGFLDASRVPITNILIPQCETSTVPPTEDIFNMPTFPLPFITSARAASDICQNPLYSHQHGFLVSPDTLRYTPSLTPIFSQAKLSPFADILIPSPFYTGRYGTTQDYSDDADPPWAAKENSLVWRGSTTGLHAFGADLAFGRNYLWGHRQRFVGWVNSWHNSTVQYLQRGRFGWRKMKGVVKELAQLIEVKFTAVIQCETVGCEEEKIIYDIGERESMVDIYQHRFVFDLDGNSFSGRYYSLLGSRSCVFKQTLFREWHDDRLIPWVHYVPVSIGMEELPEIMRYFGTTEEGQAVAERIANNGREWQQKVLRSQDFGVYWYRLILEYSRLIDDRRPAGQFDAQ
jgi:hypothetical protein